jgi:excisionase family DNA binding protein
MRVGTVQEVADLLKVKPKYVYENAGRPDGIPTLRRLGPRLRFDLDEVERWMQQRDDQPEAKAS